MTPAGRRQAAAALWPASAALAQPGARDRASTAAAAQVELVRGAALAGTRTAPATPLAPGATLAEGARIHVPDDGYLRLRLADGSVLRVLAASDLELRRLRRRGPTGAALTVIELRRGHVESEVAPQSEGRVFEIRAPGAVASVRGTRFGLSVDSDGRSRSTCATARSCCRRATRATTGPAAPW